MLSQFPELFTLGAKGKEWIPADESDAEVQRAYKRAARCADHTPNAGCPYISRLLTNACAACRYVHPDRLVGRAEGVVAEAQEIMKVLTRARGVGASQHNARRAEHAGRRKSRAAASFQGHRTAHAGGRPKWSGLRTGL